MTNIWIIYAGCACLSALVILLARNRLKLFSENEKLKAFVEAPVFWVAFAVTALLLPSVVLSSFLFFEITAGFSDFEDVTDQTAAIRNLGLVLAAFVGVPFVVWRSFVAQKQVDVSEQGQITERINKAVEGLGAEKLVKRDGKETSEPNIEVRIGAIYALERIAQDSDRDHVQIMEILCAYIRENAPAKEAEPWPEIDMEGIDRKGPLPDDWEDRVSKFKKEHIAKLQQAKMRTDIQTALTVLGRRSPHQRLLEARNNDRESQQRFIFDDPAPLFQDYCENDDYDMVGVDAFISVMERWKTELESYQGYRLDLRETNLRFADFTKVDLVGALLDGSHFEGAELYRANLRGTSLRGAQFAGTSLNGAELCGATLDRANMQAVRLNNACLHGASLIETDLRAAQISEAAMTGVELPTTDMRGANFRLSSPFQVKFTNTKLKSTSFLGTKLFGAHFMSIVVDDKTSMAGASAGFSSIRNLDQRSTVLFSKVFDSVFGDKSVELPEATEWPSHWAPGILPFVGFSESDERENYDSFFREWEKWRSDPVSYKPPQEFDSETGVQCVD